MAQVVNCDGSFASIRRQAALSEDGAELFGSGRPGKDGHGRVARADLGDTAGIRRDHRHSCRQGLEHGETEPLVIARRDEHVGGRERRGHVLHRPGPDHMAIQSEPSRLCPGDLHRPDRILAGRRCLSHDDQPGLSTDRAPGECFACGMKYRGQQVQPLLRSGIGQNEQDEVIGPESKPAPKPACRPHRRRASIERRLVRFRSMPSGLAQAALPGPAPPRRPVQATSNAAPERPTDFQPPRPAGSLVVHRHQHGDTLPRNRRDLRTVQKMSVDHVSMELASHNGGGRRSGDRIEAWRRDVNGSARSGKRLPERLTKGDKPALDPVPLQRSIERQGDPLRTADLKRCDDLYHAQSRIDINIQRCKPDNAPALVVHNPVDGSCAVHPTGQAARQAFRRLSFQVKAECLPECRLLYGAPRTHRRWRPGACRWRWAAEQESGRVDAARHPRRPARPARSLVQSSRQDPIPHPRLLRRRRPAPAWCGPPGRRSRNLAPPRRGVAWLSTPGETWAAEAY